MPQCWQCGQDLGRVQIICDQCGVVVTGSKDKNNATFQPAPTATVAPPQPTLQTNGARRSSINDKTPLSQRTEQTAESLQSDDSTSTTDGSIKNARETNQSAMPSADKAKRTLLTFIDGFGRDFHNPPHLKSYLVIVGLSALILPIPLVLVIAWRSYWPIKTKLIASLIPMAFLVIVFNIISFLLAVFFTFL